MHEGGGSEPGFSVRHLAEFVMAMGPAFTLERAPTRAALPPEVFRDMVLGALRIPLTSGERSLFTVAASPASTRRPLR